jgi:Ca2+-binding RTX toxin-like protein
MLSASSKPFSFHSDPFLTSHVKPVLFPELTGSSPSDSFGANVIFIDESPTLYDNQIKGTNNDDQLVGDERDNYILGKGSNDRLSGQSGFDILEGGNGNDRLLGGDDSDRLFGGQGNDTLIGGKDRDTLYGGSGDDRLRGSSGNDILLGGQGNNRLVGGEGNDDFILTTSGINTIIDFQNGLDRLGLPTGVGFAQLQINQQGADTVVRYVADPLLKILLSPIAVLQGIQSSTINAADFATVQIVA